MILGRSLKRNALVYGDKPAVIEAQGTVLSHKEFAERVFRLANGFLGVDLSRGSRVAILARNSTAFLEVYFAAGLIGVCLVPINFHLKPGDIESRLVHADVDALVVGAEFVPMLSGLSATSQARWAGRTYVIGNAGSGVGLEDMVREASNEEPDVRVEPEDPLYIGYTSGTTGPSKGAVISHRAIVVGYLYKALECSLNDDDVNLDPGPFWHSAPRDFATLAIYLGGTCIVCQNFEPQEYLELVHRYKVTNSFLVPAMLQMIIEASMTSTTDVSSLKRILSSGSPLPTVVKNGILTRFGPILQEGYGATETRMVTSIKSDELGAMKRCVGRAARDVEIRVLDPDGKEVARGEIGEVFVRGPGLFSGYFRDPEGTRASHRGQWFSLGDMGRMDEQDYLYLVDRKQDMIISGGENIYPNDIEEALLRHPSIKEVAVIGTPHPVWGEQVTAVVVPNAGAQVNPEDLIMHCGTSLPAYMKPRRIEVVDALPRNPVGKVLRRVLREKYWRNEESRI